ncbi:hydroxyacid dehydrogenase [Jeotgalibaca caeni]|uniref:hydroxyacid dehydrogenase n=1 Tax=Jeotgalibaca caeni TaxID=3028623 RepID=UPI00237E0FB5|nr:hydroxyacid dehydrogenase [Jeotgalibaca caeni]MDE1549289.1 hydroxyacid dehydrogenase [Jeotgalibaca caeni]
MMKSLFIMSDQLIDRDYTPEVRTEISKQVDVLEPFLTKENYHEHWELIEQADIIFSGIGAPKMDKEFLDRAPNLKAIFYAAGTMKHIFTDDEVWRRGITVTTANVPNGIPVAEFTLAQILMSLKNSWYLSRKVKEEKHFTNGIRYEIPGVYNSTVGIISFSAIGKMVIEHLKNFQVDIALYDPFVTEEKAEEIGVKLCSLDEIFQISDVVSLHAPRLPETIGMITGKHFELMKEQATFINTARGEIVREQEMILALQNRLDLTALLDVTAPEPPQPDSPLYTMENVFLTPHLAGSVGKERQRLGNYMHMELKRYLNGEKLHYQITEADFNRMA